MPWDDSGDPVSTTVQEQTNRYHQLARGLLNSWTGPTCAVDCGGSIVAVNEAWIDVAERNGGTAESCGIGVNYLDTCDRVAAHAGGLDAADAAVVAQGLAQVLAGSLDHFSHDYPCHSPRQDQWFSVRLTPAFIDDAVGAVITHVDITELHELQKSPPHQSLHEPLADLPGRALMLDRLEQAVSTSARHSVATAVTTVALHAYIDVRDRLGYRGADAVLVQIAERFQARLRRGDTLSRSSWDQFQVLWRDVDPNRPAEAVALSEGLVSALDSPFDVAGVRVLVTASAGVALHSPGQTADELLRATDAALQEARNRGPGHVVLSTDELRIETTIRRSLEADLRLALGQSLSQFVLHYQPVVDLTSGEVVAVESLVRWQHPRWGLLGPDRFIPLAESTGLIRPLGSWVLQQAIRDAVKLTHQGRDLDVAVNFSVRQLDDRAVASVQRALKGSGLRRGRLILEVTESAFVDDEVVTAATLEALSRLGVKIAIDDFGTGYSSLRYVHRYPIDSLKIDREFVAGIGGSADDEAICASITSLAAAVGASTVGEGVETMEQYAFLRSLGCRHGQGFLWSPAVPIDKLRAALASCDQVPKPAPPSSAALQRKGVDGKVTALVAKGEMEHAPLPTSATVPKGTTSRPSSGAGDDMARALPEAGDESQAEMLGAAPLVLICEDIEPIRRLLRIDLELAGFGVEEAPDGHAAMKRLIEPDTRRPDVIVLDSQKVPYDSWWAIAAIRAHPSLDDIPTLLMTAVAGDHHRAEAEKAGFDGILTKPFIPAELVSTVSQFAATGRQPHRQPSAATAVRRARNRVPATRPTGRPAVL